MFSNFLRFQVKSEGNYPGELVQKPTNTDDDDDGNDTFDTVACDNEHTDDEIEVESACKREWALPIARAKNNDRKRSQHCCAKIDFALGWGIPKSNLFFTCGLPPRPCFS